MIQKTYIIIFFSELLTMYSFIMLSVTREYSYVGLSALGAYFIIKYSLKIRQEKRKKSLLFSLFTFLSIVTMYLYYYQKYDLRTMNFFNIIVIIYIFIFIYQEFAFRIYSLERLERYYK